MGYALLYLLLMGEWRAKQALIVTGITFLGGLQLSQWKLQADYFSANSLTAAEALAFRYSP